MTHEQEPDQVWRSSVGPQENITEYPGLLLAALVESCQDAIISKNLQGVITSWNPAAVRLLGYTADEMIGQSILRIIPLHLQSEETEIIRKMTAGEQIGHYETVRLRKDGSTLPVSLTLSPVRDYFGAVIGVSKILRDMTLEKRGEESRLMLAAIVDSSDYAIIGKDLAGRVTSWNLAASAMFGYTATEMIGQPILKLVPEKLQAEEIDIMTRVQMGQKIEHLRTVRRRKDGSEIDISSIISPIRDTSGKIIGTSRMDRDISVEKVREEQLTHFSQHDQLTGLPNRRLMKDRLGVMLAQTERNGCLCAVMVLDINRFKEINDHYGHHIGDELLIEIANRLKSTLRNVDTVSRVGGDEFIILVSELQSPQQAMIVAKKIGNTFSRPFQFSNDLSIQTSASIGICMSSLGKGDENLLLRMADSAMYHAKASPKGPQIEFYSQEIAHNEFRRREIVIALQESLQTGGFHLTYQPIVDMSSGAVFGFEALIRMQNDRVGLVSPNEFIPIAEETGLIQRVGLWVIKTACQAIGELNRTLGSAFSISVNLSVKQMYDETLLSVIAKALEDNKLERGHLGIEITEGVLMEDTPHILHVLNSLRTLGVLIDIDDFGTGFSNIHYLWSFPIDRLKLDRSIISSLSSHPSSSVVAKAIISLAHQLNISVVAEGIETQEQAQIIKDAGCDLAQGYYFARPAPLDVFKTSYAHQTKE